MDRGGRGFTVEESVRRVVLADVGELVDSIAKLPWQIIKAFCFGVVNTFGGLGIGERYLCRGVGLEVLGDVDVDADGQDIAFKDAGSEDGPLKA